MVDDLNDKQPRDPNRVDLNVEHELGYWTERFGVSEEDLRAAIERVGVVVDDVERELQRSSSVGQNGSYF
jgi:hypothetical protein